VNLKKSLERRIRGWLPKEPALPRKYASGSPDDQKPKQPSKQSRFVRLIRLSLGLLFVLMGIAHLLAKQYELASLWFAGAIGATIIAYFGWSVRPRTALGGLLLALGGAMFFYNDLAVIAFSSATVFTWLLIDMARIVVFWIVIGLVIGLAYAVWAFRKRSDFLRNSLSERRLLPYGVAALFIFLTYIAVVSGIQFAYAIPITFIITGALVLKGLRRFAVTIPALIVLLISMLVFGSAVAGTYTVTYVSENRFLTSAEAPAADTLNLAVKSVGGDINLYFTNDGTQTCHIAFVKEYGPISSSRGAGYHYQSYYDSEPATGFNYTIDNGEVNVTASSYTVLVNITVNQNLKLNFDFYTYFGDITVEAPPTVNNIQTMNLTSQLGDVKLKITNTTNLQRLLATSTYTVEAYISSTSQNQNATVQLKGGTVKLNLKLTNIESQISAYSTGKYGELEAKTQGFTVLNQNNTYFNAQTPSYSTSALKKLDITATSTQSTRPSMDISANYIGK
jgi:hypothetical protein